MSSSEAGKGILMTDSPSQVKKKVNKYAFSGGKDTVEEHREHGGDPDVDVAFQYLRYMFEDDDEKLADLAKRYRSGELLTGELKKYAIEKINEFLAAHQARREKAAAQIPKFLLKV